MIPLGQNYYVNIDNNPVMLYVKDQENISQESFFKRFPSIQGNLQSL